MLVTIEELRKARTQNKGYSKKQVEYGQRLTGKQQWKQAMIGMNVTPDQWITFISLGRKTKKNANQAKAKTPINPVSAKHDGWAWKPGKDDIPPIKFKGKLQKNRGVKKKHREKLSKKDDVSFYSSREWLQLRVRVLEKYECKCMMCGRSPKVHGVIIHVDHIKPRSKFPELALEFSNLQVLCEECNMGKSNKYQTDYRPEDEITERLDIAHLITMGGYL